MDSELQYYEDLVNITNHEYQPLSYLGKGHFGKVYEVQNREGKPCAIKVVKKRDNSEQVNVETSILSRLNHPFVIQFLDSFECEKNIYIVMELLDKTLHSVLANKNYFLESVARFYMKEIILAVDYLHSEGIVYKDLKLTNILLDKTGHIKLIDFGMCEQNMHNDKVSFCFGGTAKYMAPEVYTKSGHGIKADWWSLGVTFYKMITGKFPFEATKTKTVKKVILQGKFNLPEYLSSQAKDLISKLLEFNQNERLGVSEIKKHNFFKDTSWEIAVLKQQNPPFVPKISNEYDSESDEEKSERSVELSRGTKLAYYALMMDKMKVMNVIQKLKLTRD